jgi:hypothetical protein
VPEAERSAIRASAEQKLNEQRQREASFIRTLLRLSGKPVVPAVCNALATPGTTTPPTVVPEISTQRDNPGTTDEPATLTGVVPDLSRHTQKRGTTYADIPYEWITSRQFGTD